jgi:hypothetical protein
VVGQYFRKAWTMNEQIKKLAEQAGIVIPKDSEYNGHIYRNTIEKFAALIVKDCIRLCDEVDLAGADDCIDKIRDHFGVDK